jgi:spore germination protein YaaH
VSRLPAAAPGHLQREVFGFALASSLNDPTIGYPSWNFGLLSTVAYFGLHVNDDGSFAADAGWTTWNNTQERTAFVSAAHSGGTKVVLTIILQDFATNTPHMCAALANSAATIAFTVAQVRAQGVDGANVDYEGLNGSCGNADANWARHAFSAFVYHLRAAMPAGSYLSVDTYSSSPTDPSGFFDVQAMSPNVDSFFVMAYDTEYSNAGRPPTSCGSFCLGPTAPLTGYFYNDTLAASQYVGAIPASKVILGVPYYGRKGCVTSATPNQTPTSGSVIAEGYLDASTEFNYYEVKPGSYVANRDANDPAGQERWDTWYNTTLNCTRELYWDDAVSLGHKYDLVNQAGLRGVGLWTLNYGGGAPELWNALSTHFTLIPGQPSNVNACAGNGFASVSWAAAPTRDGPITSYLVTASPGGATVTVPGSTTFATVTGLTSGTSYTLTVQATNSNGQGLGATSNAVTAGAPVYNGYFSWFDKQSPGMVGDNIHILNPGTTASIGCVTLTGRAIIPFNLGAGQEQYVTFPTGTIGGPLFVTVISGPAVLASQRVQYYQSFNEVWAVNGVQAATTSYINWFDNASPGMVADNIHVLNPGGSGANVTVSLPGATPISFSLGAGSENYVTFPGHMGGPVTISASQPVLASQRVQYNQSFNEVVARSWAQTWTTSYFNWFDRASPGMVADNIHVINPGSSSSNVTVSLPGATPISFTLAPGAATYATFPVGHIGGPVTVTASQPVLASQRVQYYSSFNEVAAVGPGQAAPTSYVMWFDKASPGMGADNIHILNPGAATATITVSLAGANPISISVAALGEAYISFPIGHLGGPVTITSNQRVLAAQRVQYYQTFNEVPASG